MNIVKIEINGKKAKFEINEEGNLTCSKKTNLKDVADLVPAIRGLAVLLPDSSQLNKHPEEELSQFQAIDLSIDGVDGVIVDSVQNDEIENFLRYCEDVLPEILDTAKSGVEQSEVHGEIVSFGDIASNAMLLRNLLKDLRK